MTTRKLIFVKAAAVVLLARSDLVAQALNPPYLREMPSVERVLSDQKTADTAETAARQMGALLQLKKMIEDAAGPRFFDRRVGLTSDETRICQDLLHGLLPHIAVERGIQEVHRDTWLRYRPPISR
jgi:hypothetical protein